MLLHVRYQNYVQILTETEQTIDEQENKPVNERVQDLEERREE